ncbi:MAG TPA: aminoacyl-tRNA hydrolase, partial [Acidimicrobiales bacterium]|nr:aminoacyl-tRNA hydrolase [Acidimicrobiales bacterium]
LGPRQRARLLDKLGPVVRVVAADERSQTRNRDIALERFKERVAQALKIETPRQATRPTRASKERRLQSKARRSSIKNSRRAVPDD